MQVKRDIMNVLRVNLTHLDLLLQIANRIFALKSRKIMLALLAISATGMVNSQAQQRLNMPQPDMSPKLASGPARKAYALFVPDERKRNFLDVVNRFVVENSFISISRQTEWGLDNRTIGINWYTRADGVTFIVTDITLPGKMKIAFFNREDGVGYEEAVVAAEQLRQRTQEYENFPE